MIIYNNILLKHLLKLCFFGVSAFLFNIKFKNNFKFKLKLFWKHGIMNQYDFFQKGCDVRIGKKAGSVRI